MYNESMRTLVLLLVILSARFCWGQQIEDDAYFESNVRPLLSERCFECHRRKAEGGLRLDSAAAIASGGVTGPAVVPGDPANSLLWQAVAGKHEELSMPPDAPLDEAEVEILRKWIATGAHWPKSSESRTGNISDDEREFWSFQPLARPSLPQLDEESANPIDAFISKERRDRQLMPTQRASASTLIRRLRYDLTGLPPTPQEVSDFETAFEMDATTAMAELVERLLASNQYGQRWAQHWLDLVRYADTAGDAADYPVPEAYKYRNYVIDAFNDDKPYDQFVREQIAGDLLSSDTPDQSWAQTIATGYIAISRRIGVTPESLPHITIEDTIDNVGKTFLGLSIGCARCHDHKFDPIPTSDYYALYGIFKSTVYPHAGAEHKPYRSDFVYRVGKIEADRLLSDASSAIAPLLKKERVAFERYKEFQIRPVDRPGYNRDVAWREVINLRNEIAEAAKSFPEMETAYAVSEGKPEDAFIQKQGEPRYKGDIARRGFLQILGGQVLPSELANQSGRLQLANWIADENNPLTARVIVNRIWHHHFGRGLVATTSDFGVRGSPPSHPQLLDFLAQYLIDNKWSIKQLHRLILTSKTYQLDSDDVPESSALDPENIYLWRSNRRRLDAEQIRDSILAFSGQLDETTGGRHPFPHPLTYFYRQHEPFVGNFETNQRTIFQFRQRIRKNTYLDTFDASDGNLHVGERRATTTSIQSLYFLNSEFIDQQSKAIFERLRNQTQSPEHRVQWLYSNLFGRSASQDEVQAVLVAVNRLQGVHQAEAAWPSLIRAMLCSNAFLFVD